MMLAVSVPQSGPAILSFSKRTEARCELIRRAECRGAEESATVLLGSSWARSGRYPYQQKGLEACST